MYKFSRSSLKQLVTCHPALQEIAHEAIKVIGFQVTEGHRGKERQDRLVAEGKSKAPFPTSYHNKTPSLAFDLLPSPFGGWDDINQFYRLAGVIQTVAAVKGYNVEWGGDFKGFFDGMHFQLVLED